MKARVAVLPVVRKGPLWVVLAAPHGVIVHGRTLCDLQASAQAALALKAGDGPAPKVELAVQLPEAEALGKIRIRYEAALRRAIEGMRADGASWPDIAFACRIRVADAKALINHGSPNKQVE